MKTKCDSSRLFELQYILGTISGLALYSGPGPENNNGFQL